MTNRIDPYELEQQAVERIQASRASIDAQLSKVIIGHCRYYGITGNSIQIGRFRQEVQRAWRVWLNRRSQRAKMTWARFHKLAKRYPLPPAIAYHSVCRP